jgi:AcrR family transcriptional regulator
MATRAAVRRSRKDRAELLAKSPRLQRIVEELETLFFKEGFLHIHTEELARRLHCSKQTLYTLAQSRDELFEVILERFLSGIRAQARQASELPDRVAALTGCLDAVKQAVSKVSMRFAEDLNEFPRGQRRRREHEDMMASMIADIISAGTHEGAADRRSIDPRGGQDRAAQFPGPHRTQSFPGLRRTAQILSARPVGARRQGRRQGPRGSEPPASGQLGGAALAVQRRGGGVPSAQIGLSL